MEADGWRESGGHRYYICGGAPETGWHGETDPDEGQRWYYLWPFGWEGHPKGSMARDCVVSDYGRLYRMTEDGTLAKGFLPPARIETNRRKDV